MLQRISNSSQSECKASKRLTDAVCAIVVQHIYSYIHKRRSSTIDAFKWTSWYAFISNGWRLFSDVPSGAPGVLLFFLMCFTLYWNECLFPFHSVLIKRNSHANEFNWHCSHKKTAHTFIEAEGLPEAGQRFFVHILMRFTHVVYST